MNIKQVEDRVHNAVLNGLLNICVSYNNEIKNAWVCFASLEDSKIYDSKNSSEFFEVFLMNSVLVCRPSWGARLQIKNDHISYIDIIEQIEFVIESGDYPSFKER